MKTLSLLPLVVLLPALAAAGAAAQEPDGAQGAPTGGAGEDASVGDAESTSPAAEVESAALISCTSGAGCPGGLGCVGGVCALCTRHDQCASDVCDVYAGAVPGRGRCVPEDQVLYVRGRGPEPACQGTGDGSRGGPFCSIRDAVAAASPARNAIRVYPGWYFPFHVVDKSVRIFGPAGEGGAAEVSEEDIGGSSVRGSSTVLLDGLALGRNSRVGLSCTGGASRPNLWVRRSEILSDIAVAFVSRNCDLRMDRDTVTGLYGGMRLESTSYRITNSFVTDSNRGTGIRLIGSTGLFRFNTITNNGVLVSGQPGGIDCGASPVRLESSIVYGNQRGPGGSQLAGACVLSRVVVGAADATAAPGAIKLNPDLIGFELPRTPANLACCIDKAAPQPAVRADIVGTIRPVGPSWDIGAFEALLP